MADRRLAFTLGGLCAAGLVWIIGIGGGARSLGWLLPMSLSLGEHSLVHERTIEAIRDSRMLGTGFGTFEEAFRFYRTDDIQGDFGTSHFTYLANVLSSAYLSLRPFFACSLFSRLADRASRNGATLFTPVWALLRQS